MNEKVYQPKSSYFKKQPQSSKARKAPQPELCVSRSLERLENFKKIEEGRLETLK